MRVLFASKTVKLGSAVWISRTSWIPPSVIVSPLSSVTERDSVCGASEMIITGGNWPASS